MINVSDEIKNLLQENYRQLIKIEFPNNGETIRLTEGDLAQGSFQWDRYCSTGDMLEIGSAISAEVAFTLLNNGYFSTSGGEKVSVDDISFEGKELSVQMGISKWGARRWENAQILWFSVGKFTIMSMPHKFSTIKISALDRMTWFDMYIPSEDRPFLDTETLHGIVAAICGALNINYIFPSTLPNYDMQVDMAALLSEETQTTYRMMIQWVAALTGTCAYINAEGTLVFGWLNETGESITPHHRYSSAVYEPVFFGGMVVEKDEDSLELGSDSMYRFVISNNSLIQGEDWKEKYLKPLENVWDKLRESSFPYRPFEASIVPMPYLEPLDIVEYRDNNGEVFNTIITNITFTLNGATNISAVGISETEAQCITPSGSTGKEDADISRLRSMIDTLENATAAARNRLTSMVQMALGLHMITVTADDGGIIYYFTTANISDSADPSISDMEEVLQPNDVIYQVSGGGLAWCFGSDWSTASHAPESWKYGISKDGSAVLGIVNTAGIEVSREDSVYKTLITPETYAIYQGVNLVLGLNGQLESQINRLLVKSNIDDPMMDNNAYIRLGSAMLVPASGGMDIVYVEDI